MLNLIVLVIGLVVGPAFGDEIDWKLTFHEKKRQSVNLLERMEPQYFSGVDEEISKDVIAIWKDHQGEMVDFLRKACVKHIDERNPNKECVEILDPNKTELQVSRVDCENKCGRAMQRDILRELFRMAGADDELSRWGAFALEEGWAKNEGTIPPFAIVGTYSLKEIGGSHTIEVRISRNEKNRLEIKVDSLRKRNGDTLIFDRLNMESGKKGTADANNPTKVTKAWGSIQRTLYGNDHIEISLQGRNEISLSFHRLNEYEFPEVIYYEHQAFVRQKSSSHFYYRGTKTSF